MVKAHLEQYPFNSTCKKRGYTNKEYREAFSEEQFRAIMAKRIRQKKKYSLKLFSSEEAFLQTHPNLVREM
jgi:hypothetical protein